MQPQTLPPLTKAIQYPAIVRTRVKAIDLWRGIVMIIMALDHTRDFIHLDTLNGQNPLDFSTTSTWLFLTRWITHLCAPSFVFLSGTSIFFVSQRKTKNEIAFFLFTRGLWLMLLELTLLNFAWAGPSGYALLGLGVIWVIGLCMVLLAPLIYLSKKLLLTLGILLVFSHNLLDPYNKVSDDLPGVLWSILHVPHTYILNNGNTIEVLYCAIPWLGLMIMGYLFGNIYQKQVDETRRKKILIGLGTGCILLFVLLRAGNIYGDAHHWQKQETAVFSFLSFIDTTKYPPSLLYMLMTIGPTLLFLAFAERLKGKLVNAISVFGRVPLFYYILHIILIHAIAWIIFWSQGYSMLFADIRNPDSVTDGVGVSLGWVYVIWLTVILLLYWPCKWYNTYKSTHKDWWLSYL
jgi:uncharacterized membrane protein